MDFKDKSKDELISILEDFYANPNIDLYFAIKKQLIDLAHQIEEAEIKFDAEETTQFKNFLQFSKESVLISNNLKEIQANIDNKILKEEENKRTSAKKGSIESYVTNRR